MNIGTPKEILGKMLSEWKNDVQMGPTILTIIPLSEIPDLFAEMNRRILFLIELIEQSIKEAKK